MICKKKLGSHLLQVGMSRPVDHHKVSLPGKTFNLLRDLRIVHLKAGPNLCCFVVGDEPVAYHKYVLPLNWIVLDIIP